MGNGAAEFSSQKTWKCILSNYRSSIGLPSSLQANRWNSGCFFLLHATELDNGFSLPATLDTPPIRRAMEVLTMVSEAERERMHMFRTQNGRFLKPEYS